MIALPSPQPRRRGSLLVLLVLLLVWWPLLAGVNLPRLQWGPKITPLPSPEIRVANLTPVNLPTPLPQVEVVPVLQVTMTAYNSLANQTDSTPFITATGQRTRPGIVAVSRDLLAGPLPYGSSVRVVSVNTDANGCSGWLPGTTLEVQDTMHARKRNQVDLWLPHYEDALRWGRCQAVVQILASK